MLVRGRIVTGFKLVIVLFCRPGNLESGTKTFIRDSFLSREVVHRTWGKGQASHVVFFYQLLPD